MCCGASTVPKYSKMICPSLIVSWLCSEDGEDYVLTKTYYHT